MCPSTRSDYPRKLVNDEPENRCFGCSPHNARGLQLEFEELGPGEIRSSYAAEADLDGAPGVVHGGVQAALLDEMTGIAIHSAYPDEDHFVVTAEFKLRYRRPVLSGIPLLLTGQFLRNEGRNFFAEGQIRNEANEVLTQAEARWVKIPPPKGSSE